MRIMPGYVDLDLETAGFVIIKIKQFLFAFGQFSKIYTYYS